MARSCTLCGDSSTKLTKEDVFPVWLLNYANSRADGPFTGRWHGKPWSGELTKMTARVVCQSCNEWMGETFEGPTKGLLIRLIEGQQHSLTPTDQDLVARWATKTALMSVLGRRTAGEVPPSDYYRYFRKSGGQLLPRSVVSVGYWIDSEPAPSVSPSYVGRLTSGGRIERGVEGSRLTSWRQPHLIGQLMLDFLHVPQGSPSLVTIAHLEGLLHPLGHERPELAWPPATGLDRHNVAKIGQLVVLPAPNSSEPG